MMRLKSRSLWLIGIGTASIAIALGLFLAGRGNSAEKLSRSVAASVLSRDVDELVRATPDFELEQMGISRPAARRLIEEVILPKFYGIERRGSLSTQMVNDAGMAATSVPVKLRNGRLYTYSAWAVNSDNGAVTLIRSQLFRGWLVEYMQASPDNAEDQVAACYWGLSRDIARLKALGVKNMPAKSADLKPIPLDTFLWTLKKNLDMRQAGQRLPPTK